jgi:SAM-dependent methyltransferase
MRDTDRDWTLIAEHEPYYGVLANPQYRADQLNEATIADFYASGVGDIDHVVARLRALGGGSFAPRDAIDFGAGVGRLSFAMARHAGRVIGVDVAPGMRAVGEEQARRQGVGNVEFRAEIPDQPVDWINSLIVFQHIPPRRGYELLDQLLTQVRPGGAISLQITVFHDQRHTGELLRDVADYQYDGETAKIVRTAESEAGGMSMYDYDLSRVFALLVRHDLHELHIDHTDHAGCHGAWIFGRRRASS